MDAAYGVVHLWNRHDNCGGSAAQAESGISRLYGNDVLFQYVGHMAGDMCKKRYQDAAVTVLLGASLICYTLAFASGGPVY